MIYELLKHGLENAISKNVLAAICGADNPRTLQKMIAAEREAGFMILSSSRGGYYKPSLNPEQARQEILAYEKTLKNRALNTLKILKSARRELRTVNEQASLFDNGGD